MKGDGVEIKADLGYANLRAFGSETDSGSMPLLT